MKAEPEAGFNFRRAAWTVVALIGEFILVIAALALIGMFCWNHLTGLTTLPSVTFNEAFTVTILLRVLSFATRH